MSAHCSDNASDRQVGELWERWFCRMAAGGGKVFTPHQIGRSRSAAAHAREDGRWSTLTLPDVTIWSAPGEHHEIKHKNRDRKGCYGLERYRLDALIRFANTTGQGVYYTIHDWELAGASDSREPQDNDITHWFYADVGSLSRARTRTAPGYSYYGGIRRWIGEEMGGIVYWDAERFFRPLGGLWDGE